MSFVAKIPGDRLSWFATLAFAVPQVVFDWFYGLRHSYVLEAFADLGFPLYLPGPLAVAKTLALFFVLAPASRRVKEWAYAWISFEALGAAIAHLAHGDSLGFVIAPLVLFGLQLFSYFLWKERASAVEVRAGTLVANPFLMDRSSNQIRILYWTLTLLFVVPQSWSAFEALTEAPRMTATITGLGYPVYFMKMLAVFKIAGVVAIVTGFVPTLKEWAYAGFTFDVLGALYSHLRVGDSLLVAAVPFVFLVVQFGSYFAGKELERRSRRGTEKENPIPPFEGMGSGRRAV